MEEFSRDIRRVPVLRALFPWIGGVILAKYVQAGPKIIIVSAVLLCVLIMGLILYNFVGRRSPLFSLFLNINIFLSFVVCGFMYFHFPHSRPSVLQDDSSVALCGMVGSSPVFRGGSFRFELKAEAVYTGASSHPIRGKLLLRIDSVLLHEPILAGDRLLLTGKLRKIRNGLNPSAFDYALYMQRRGIEYQLTSSAGDTLISLSGNRASSIRSLPYRVVNLFTHSWEQYGEGKEESLAVLKAITLGDKGSLSEELRQAYSGAGAAHVLAVSGLHVGMIWLILEKILAFRSKKIVIRLLRSLLIVSLLWFYAALTGWSSSVCRSVTMFTLVSLAGLFSRNSSILNTMLLSALLLLCIAPSRIYDTGFQLSYMALTGIILLQPVLAGCITPRTKIMKWIRDLVSVSVAAQLFTLPLTLGIFHQFPTAFILTNLLVIPLATAELCLFIVSAPLFLAGLACRQLTFLLLIPSFLMNRCTEAITSLPGAVISSVHFPGISMLLFPVLLLSLTAFLYYRKLGWLLSSMTLLAVILLALSYLRVKEEQADKLLLAHFYGSTVLVSSQGMLEQNLIIASERTDTSAILDWIKRREAEGIRGRQVRITITSREKLESEDCKGCYPLATGLLVWSVGDFVVLFTGKEMPEPGPEQLSRLHPDLVVTGDLPAGKVRQLAELLPGTVFVADGSTPPWIGGKLEEEVPGIWMTRNAGAFLLSKQEFIKNSNCDE